MIVTMGLKKEVPRACLVVMEKVQATIADQTGLMNSIT